MKEGRLWSRNGGRSERNEGSEIRKRETRALEGERGTGSGKELREGASFGRIK